MSAVPGHSEIEEALDAALAGSRDGAARFYTAFLDGQLYVLQRAQVHPMIHVVEPENQFLDLLALESPEGIFLPAFTRPELIEEWCGKGLECRPLTGAHLLTLLPDDWQVTLNPGSDAGKELTAWELTQLRSGREAIPEIINELFAEEPIETIEITGVGGEEYPALFETLTATVKQFPEVRHLYLLREVGRTIEGDQVNTLLLGIDASATAEDRMEAIKEHLQNAGRLTLIGSDALKVRIGNGIDSVILSIFRESEPIYRKGEEKGFWGNLFGRNRG